MRSRRHRFQFWGISDFIDSLILPDKWIHNDKISVDRLRKRLQFIEKVIFWLIGGKRNGDEPVILNLTEFEENLIEELMGSRDYIMERMFYLAGSEEEIEHLESLNDTLRKMTDRMYEKSASTYRDILSRPIDLDFEDDMGVESHIRFVFNDSDSVLRIQNDDWYGSDFERMIELKYLLMEDKWEEIECVNSWRRCNQTPEMTDKQLDVDNSFEDGTSWTDGIWERNPRLAHINMCHAFHDLNDHKHYTLPEMARLNDFWCEVKLIRQLIADQSGRHSSYIVDGVAGQL